MPRVVHFEFVVDDPDRAIQFYTDVFGWEISKWDGPQEYWLVRTGPSEQPGIDGGFMLRQEGMQVVNTIDVDSVDTFLERISARGGQVVVPKMAVPQVGYMAYCTDTEGNLFGIMQADMSAQ